MSLAANNLNIVYRDIGDYENAFKYYCISEKLLSDKWNTPIHTFNVGLCHYFGIGTEQNAPKAIEIFKAISKSTSNGNYPYEVDEANYHLGLIYLQSIFIAKDTSQKPNIISI